MNTPPNTLNEIYLTDLQKERIKSDIDTYLLSEIQRGSDNFEREICRIDLFSVAHIGMISQGENKGLITFDSNTILKTEDWIFIKKCSFDDYRIFYEQIR